MSQPFTIVPTPHLVSTDATIILPVEIHISPDSAATAVYEDDDGADVTFLSLDALALAHMLTGEGLDEATAVEQQMLAAEQDSAYLVLGRGVPGLWGDHASAVLPEHADLRQHARDHGLFDRGAVDGLCSLSGVLREGAWFVVVTTKASQLNRDPSVLIYCDAP